MSNKIHSTAIIHESLNIGDGNEIGAYAIIGPNVVIGNNNYIGPYCFISDHPESVKFFGSDNFGVIIGNHCRFTGKVTIDGGTLGPTIIGNDILMLKNAHVGHDSVLCKDVQLRCNVIIGGHVHIYGKTKLGLGAIVHPRVIIPPNVSIGMGAIITKRATIKANEIWVGNPAKFLKCVG